MADKVSLAEKLNLPPEIGSKDEDRRRLACHSVGIEFDRRTRALSSASERSKYQESIYQAIFQLTDSKVVEEQLGGLQLIEELTHRESDDSASKVTSFANYLRPRIESAEPAVVTLATNCLGQLARAESGHAAVKPELERGLDRLKAGSMLSSAVLVLRQLAEHAPTLTFVHLDDVFTHLWTAMRDSRVATREGAAAVLRACLALVANRKSAARKRWYSLIYREAMAMLAEKSGGTFTSESRPTEAVHGALLTVSELLQARGLELSEEQFDELIVATWACRDHRDKLVRRAMLEVPPRMAAYCEGCDTTLFVNKYLQSSVTLMITALKSRDYAELRPVIFLAIGDIALHTKSSLNGARQQRSEQRRAINVGIHSAHGAHEQASAAPDEQSRVSGNRSSDPVHTVGAARGASFHDSGRSSPETGARSRGASDVANESSEPPAFGLSRRNTTTVGSSLSASILSLHRSSMSIGAPSFLTHSRASVSRVELKRENLGSKHPIVEHLPAVLQELCESLPLPRARGTARKPPAASCPEAIECVSKLAIAMGPAFGAHVTQLAPHLFSSGLSPTLLDALSNLSKHVPSVKETLQKHVLDGVSAALAKHDSFDDFLALAAPDRTAALALSVNATGADGDAEADGGGVGVVALAVRTLAIFNGVEWHLTPSVLSVVLEMASHFLDATALEVRRSATVACTTLLSGALGPHELGADAADHRSFSTDGGAEPRRGSAEGPTGGARAGVRWADGGTGAARSLSEDSGNAARARLAERDVLRQVCSEVLQKVLLCGVVDLDPWIRLKVIESLGAGFDEQLSQPDALRAILMALDDEEVKIRLATAEMLGRLAHSSPTLVLPRVRSELMQLAAEIAHPPLLERSMHLERCLRVIGALASSAGRLVAPYFGAILRAISPCLADEVSTVAAAALTTLSQLARVSPESVRPLASEVLPLAVSALHRQTPTIKVAALAAISQVPVAVMADVASSEPEYYHAVAIYALESALLDPTQAQWHYDTASTLTKVTLSLGPLTIARFVPSVVPVLTHAIGTIPATKWADLLIFLTDVVALCAPDPSSVPSSQTAGGGATTTGSEQPSAAEHIREQMPALLELIHRLWAADAELVTDEVRVDVQRRCLQLLERLSLAVGEAAFSLHLPSLMPLQLALLGADSKSSRRKTARAAIRTLAAFLPMLGEHLHPTVDALLGLVDVQSEAPLDLRVDALTLLNAIISQHRITPLAAPIVHAFGRALDGPCKLELIGVLCTLGARLGKTYLVFEPTVRHAIKRQRETPLDLAARDARQRWPEMRAYEHLLFCLMEFEDEAEALVVYEAGSGYAAGGAGGMGGRKAQSGALEPLALPAFSSLLPVARGSIHNSSSAGGVTPLVARGSALEVDGRRQFTESNRERLARAWDVQQRTTAADWRDWLRILSLTLLKESPSTALLKCSALAERSSSLRVQLFNAAFVSCWDELVLHDELSAGGGGSGSVDGAPGLSAARLVESLTKAMDSEQMPSDLIQRILNLAEYMERHENGLHGTRRPPLGVAWSTLGAYAERCHAYAKALRYKELEIEDAMPTREMVEGLISTSFVIGQTHAAKGILDSPDILDLGGAGVMVPAGGDPCVPKLSDSPQWHERLNEYKHALDGYERMEAQRSNDITLRISAKLGRMRCLHALGEWADLSNFVSEIWDDDDSEEIQMAGSGPEVAALGAAACLNLAIHARADEAPASHWTRMLRYVDGMQPGHVDTCTYKAILAVRNGALDVAQRLIDEARGSMYEEISALVSESYSRAYASLIKLQRLSELEEVVLHHGCPEALPVDHLVALWGARLSHTTRSVDVWQPLLEVQLLAAPPKANLTSMLQFAQLAQHSRRRSLAIQALTSCGAPAITHAPPAMRRWSLASRRHSISAVSPAARTAQRLGRRRTSDAMTGEAPFAADGIEYEGMPIRVWFGLASFLWHDGERDAALHCMRSLLKTHGGSGVTRGHDAEGAFRPTPDSNVASRAWITLGEWERHVIIERGGSLADDIDGGVGGSSKGVDALLAHYGAAADLNPSSYRAWHQLALVHYEVVQSVEQLGDERSATRQHKSAAPLSVGYSDAERAAAAKAHVVHAIECFFQSIALGAAQQRSLQDILRLLTLWFQHGGDSDGEPPAAALRDVVASQQRPQPQPQQHVVDHAIAHGLERSPIDVWLAVIPQLIARIHNPVKQIRETVCDLLVRIGLAHPQGLCFPLTVASHSRIELQHTGAARVLDAMRRSSDALVQQAHLVATELIRTAALWSETWQDALTEASSLYYGSNDVDGMIAALEPCHRMMASGPQTLSETTFEHAFGRQLQEAWTYVGRFRQSHKRADINAAWELYKQAFARISARNRAISKLELSVVSPALLAAADLELAVPGTYQPGVPIVRIRSFSRSMSVIVSKQRPRTMSMYGDDDKKHSFLLKGHEDLRQDERVMQLFGLVNALLALNTERSRTELSIMTYSVIPLSPTSGLIGWVPNAPTINTLITSYRKARNIKPNIEKELIARHSPARPGYEGLPLPQKVAVFRTMLDQTSGDALAQVLWRSSLTAERWLERRTKYTRSVAVMSMVGYILGLGDRHLSNLLLDQVSGEVLHIDFGDCFEVAVHRDKFPETVPFRLTRMLVKAMGVTGVEGNFRAACEDTMEVLHTHKDSVMAMLEAFLHDPLVNWRLLSHDDDDEQKKTSAVGRRGAVEGGGDDLPASRVSHTLPTGLADDTPLRIDRNVESVLAERTVHHHASDALQDERLLNRQAQKIVRRVESKLLGTDFPPEKPPMQFPIQPSPKSPAHQASASTTNRDVAMQVSRLIHEAQSHANLCQLYSGWNPYW